MLRRVSVRPGCHGGTMKQKKKPYSKLNLMDYDWAIERTATPSGTDVAIIFSLALTDEEWKELGELISQFDMNRRQCRP